MTHRLLTISFAMTALAVSSIADAQGRSGGARDGAGNRPSETQRDMTSMQEQADERRAEAEEHSLESEQRRLEAEAKRAEGEAHNLSEQARAEHAPNEKANEAAMSAERNGMGNEKAAEMRARRDEGKAIKEDYRATREPGQEGVDSDEAGEEAADDQKAKAKKPWWKFWGD